MGWRHGRARSNLYPDPVPIVRGSPHNPTYRGRFAPSPTGALHFGSLVAAVGSYLDARSRRGEWRVRMEDLDQAREVPGAAAAILRTLDAFGLHWDGEVVYQSRRNQAYREAVAVLSARGLLYPCACSRREIAVAGRLGAEGPVYPGTCRGGIPEGREARSLRVRTAPGRVDFFDRIQHHQRHHMENDTGDFVARRADGLYAYQLAVVVDDAWQGITHVVRGADLLLSTPRQIYLQQALDLPRPEYAHLPLATDSAGRKLSKQSADVPVDPRQPQPSLVRALKHLGQVPPPEPPADLEELWRWAIRHWDIRRVPARARRNRVDGTLSAGL